MALRSNNVRSNVLCWLVFACLVWISDLVMFDLVMLDLLQVVVFVGNPLESNKNLAVWIVLSHIWWLLCFICGYLYDGDYCYLRDHYLAMMNWIYIGKIVMIFLWRGRTVETPLQPSFLYNLWARFVIKYLVFKDAA